MPIPMEYQHASDDFERFLQDARDAADLTTRNQTYTMIEGVLRTFRRRLDPQDALRFAEILPPVIRAIFVDRWTLSEPKLPFESRDAMIRDVQALRPHHNFAPDNAIEAVATALRYAVDGAELDRVLATLPEGASAFWRIPASSNGADLQPNRATADLS